MTDYLVYKAGGTLALQLYSQYAEEDLLLKNFEPGRNLVLIPDVVAASPETEARRLGEMYFSGEYRDSKRIDCWAAGALRRQACLLSQ